ncbi:MAG: hypothetical protein E7254_01545 [Lachnospiraceae bacterium]|nr:hypothetical protein [Lachnospiraceae bacterium]
MSFSKINKIIKVVLSPSIKAIIDLKNKDKLKNQNGKRTFLFTSKYVKGSFTIEAALSLSAVIFSILMVVGIMITVNCQQCVQMSLDNVAKKTAKLLYYKEQAETIIKNNKYYDVDSKIEELLLEHGIEKDNVYLLSVKEYLSEKLLCEYLERNFISEMDDLKNAGICIDGGMTEVDFSESGYNKKSGELMIMAGYKIKVPFVPKSIGLIKSKKCTKIKVWNGKSVCKESRKVYITKNGSVYHARRDCSHITISLRECKYSQIANKRNSEGGKYYKCAYCCSDEVSSNQMVFYTEYGSNYHLDMGCGSITRNVIEIDIDQVGNRTPCKDCCKEENVNE